VNAILIIATNTFRQTVRQRLFLNIVLFGIGMVIFAMIIGRITFGYPDRVVRSIGLSGVAIALDLMALLIGVTLIHQEIDRKTLFVVLTRPLRRSQYVAGRYLGLLAALAVMTLGLGAIFTIVLVASRGSLTSLDLIALSACFPEAAVMAGVGVVLSSFTTPTIGAGLGLGIWIISASTDDLVRLMEPGSFELQLAEILSYVFPSLARFNFREAAVYQILVPIGDWASVWLLGIVYGVALVGLASLILSRREMV
jgi:Cu-processing system permease protein